jgi:hypothetical protein
MYGITSCYTWVNNFTVLAVRDRPKIEHQNHIHSQIKCDNLWFQLLQLGKNL